MIENKERLHALLDELIVEIRELAETTEDRKKKEMFTDTWQCLIFLNGLAKSTEDNVINEELAYFNTAFILYVLGIDLTEKEGESNG